MRRNPGVVLDTSVSNLLNEIDSMLFIEQESSAKKRLQINDDDDEDIQNLSSINHLQQQQAQQQQNQNPNFSQNNIAFNKNGAYSPSPKRRHHHQPIMPQQQQNYYSPSASPSQNQNEEYFDDVEEDVKQVINSSCQNPDALRQARQLFHYKAWSRLRWHAATQILLLHEQQHHQQQNRRGNENSNNNNNNSNDQDPVGHFLEGYACAVQYLSSPISAPTELLDSAILSIGKCLVLLSQIEGCDLKTVVWEQYIEENSGKFHDDENHVKYIDDEQDFTVADVMQLMQTLEQEKEKQQLGIQTGSTRNGNNLNAIYIDHSPETNVATTQQPQQQQQFTNNTREKTPPYTVPLAPVNQRLAASPVPEKSNNNGTPKPNNNYNNDNDENQGNKTPNNLSHMNASTPTPSSVSKPFKNLRDPSHHPNYNNFLEDFIETSLANSEGKTLRYRKDDEVAAMSKDRAERLRMLKKLSTNNQNNQNKNSDSQIISSAATPANPNNNENDDVVVEDVARNISKTPTADFLARQRGEDPNSTRNTQSPQHLNPDQLQEEVHPIYQRPVTIPAWALILLVLFSYLGVKSLWTKTEIVEKIVCPDNQAEKNKETGNSFSTKFFGKGQPKETDMKQEENSGTKKKKFGFW